jgi:hypothetical protein
MKKHLASLAAFSFICAISNAQIVLSPGTYTENFDGIGAGLPTGWDVRTGANATSLGTVVTFTTTATAWSITTGEFRNSASATGSTATDTGATQAANTDRALGLRQTAAFGDPGAAFNVNLDSSGLQVTQITIDLMMLSVQPRSTVWSLQYGIGAAPAAFTTLATWNDPGVFGTTNFSFTPVDFGTNLDNVSNFWFRVVALSSTTGSGNRDTMAIDNFTITTVLIPEPSTYALLALALVAIVLVRRRLAKKSLA